MNIQQALKQQGYELTRTGNTWETWEIGDYRVLVGIDSSTLIVKHYKQGSLDYLTEFHNYHNQPNNIITAIAVS